MNLNLFRDGKLIAHYLKPHGKLVTLNIVLMILMAFVQGFSIGMLIPILESLSGSGTQNSFTNIFRKGCEFFGLSYGFNTLIIVFSCMIFLRIFVEASQSHFRRELTATFSAGLQNKIFDNLMDLPLVFYYKRKVGDLIATQFTSSNNSGGIVDHSIGLLKSSFLVVVYFITGCLISVKMTIIIVFMGLLSLVLVRKNFSVVHDRAQEQKQIMDQIHSFLHDILSGIKTVKNFNNEYRHRNESENLIGKFKNYAVSIMDRKIMALAQLESFLFLMIIVSLLIAVNIWHVPMVSLIIILFIFVQLVPQVNNINRSILGIKEFIPHIAKVNELIERSDKYYLPTGNDILKVFSREIRIENLYFRYEGSHELALKNINMVIKKGSNIALVGSSGAGKTTLVDLIMRYHDPDKGYIWVDGKNLKDEIDIFSWKQHIGSVEQNPFIFNGTVYENILYGKPEAEYEDIVKAAKLAYAHNFIMELSDGYDTLVGNRGMLLSGGQQQRIALSRVFLKNPSILVLDEATSALDSESENFIQKAMDQLKRKRTLIVIAHRLSTIVNADMIFFIEKGRIVETGNHETLIQKKNRYFYFYKLQFEQKQTNENNEKRRAS